MTELTLTPQQQSIATLKANLHLPNGGFHKLIVELAREYTLPFQTVRKVLKHSQKTIEKKIKQDIENVSDAELSQKHWLVLIHADLSALAKQNQPLMDTLQNSQLYRDTLSLLTQPTVSEHDREVIRDNLAMVYEIEVYKPLTEMLYTSILIWKLPDDLFQMTDEKQAIFSGYSQHMEATRHLLRLLPTH